MDFTLNTKEEFIKTLQRERTDYKHASQVRMQAKSLMQLSVGIYTEPERFVYELLQNAVDAFTDTLGDTLNILIKSEDDRIVFMHNGKGFDEKDVESVCDVGNGTKSNDSKKIGYKGIGFKSVFMPSVDCVSIISDQFCFEFDKNKAFSLMPSFPPKEGELKPDDIPWQVIPIYSPQLKTLSDPAFNVVTVVHTKESEKIVNQIENLFSDLKFLLFLRSNNVNIRYEHNGRTIFSVGKKQTEAFSNDISKVTLFRNNEPQSSWILYTDTVAVPEKIKDELEHDFNTPDKLKQAQNVEISFAIQVSDNKVIPLDGNSIFTFLPTSYRSLRQPFLINSNFITDAGRQQLHQQSEWNKLIFRNIPGIYLKFISLISRTYSNYCEVLPNLSPDYDSLTKEYSFELEKALNSIEFVPNHNGNRLLKLEDVLVDKTGISKSVIFSKFLLQHLNSRRGTSLSEDNYVDDPGIADYAEDYINLFETKNLVRFIADRTVLLTLSLQERIAFIRFIYKYFSKADTGLARYQEELGNISFLLDKKGELRRPNELFFPSEFQEQNKETAEIVILNEDIYKNIKEDTGLIEWLKSLGIRELSNISFLKFLLENPNYITAEKAISLGRFIFRELNKFDYTEKQTFIKNRRNLLFLTKDGKLRPICNLYLGTKYKPDDDMESVYPKPEIYISDDYIEGNNADDWSYFLKKCGVKYKIGVCPHDYSTADLNFDFLKQAAASFTCVEHSKSNYWGHRNLVENIHFRLYYFTFIDFSNPQYSLDKYIFSRVLSQDRSVWNKKDLVYGWIHYWNYYIEGGLLNYTPNTFKTQFNSYLEYLLAKKQLFPTTKGTSEAPANVFINSTKNKELCGKYLPVLALDSKVHESWNELIHFKQTLMLEDLLLILQGISLDDELNSSERKTKISRIYSEIIDRDEQNSAAITDWAKTHRILAESGEFLPPSALTYILVDGFKNNEHKAYCGKTGQSSLELLKTFGVRVITEKDVTPDFNNSVEKDELKELIFKKLKYISVLKSGDSSAFSEESTNRMRNKVQQAHFYKCESITLSYGENQDTISKSTYYKDNSFYYTGKITPALLDPLITYLCSLLNINASESNKLMVIFMTDNQQLLKDYLEDRGYDVSMFNTDELHSAGDSEDCDLIDSEDNTDDNTAAGTDIFSMIGKGEDSPLSDSAMIDAQIEAQRYLMQEEPEWTFPEKYGMCDKDGNPYHYSTVDVTDEDGNSISIVLKSHKKKDSPFKINAAEWEYLVKRSAYLLIYTGNDIRKITKEDLIKNQSRISLSFSTENLDTDDCIEKFCSALHYFKELHFDFDSFNINQDTESIRSIFNINNGTQDDNTLMDI